MKVVILCGGLGTRLREETEFRPKPMVPIGQKPILWHIMKTYAHYGFKEFVLCLGYKGEKIREYFNGKNPDVPEDWVVTPVDTGERSAKGARLKKIQKYITGDTFMVTYGDGVANVDIKELLAFHQKHGKLATVTGVHPRSSFGEIRCEKDGKVTQFIEKPQFSAILVNGGFFALKTKVLEHLSEDDSCDFEDGLLTKLVTDGQVMVYEHKGVWDCMDNHREMLFLNELWDKNQAFWKVWK